MLATATLVAVLPTMFVGPIAGALVDRWNRRLIMIGADALIALVTLGLILLYRAGNLEVWQVYVAMAVRSLLGGFHWNAMQASTSLMVPDAQLTRISGLNQTLHGAMNIIAPPLGALLLGLFPLGQVLAVDLVTAALAVAPLLVFRIPQPAPRPATDAALTAGKPSVWADLRAGLRYVVGWPGLAAIFILAMFINFVSVPAFSLMPLLVTQHFGGGAPELGWLEAAWGVGVVAGGILLSVWGGFKRRILTSLMGILGIGAGMIIMGLTPASALLLAVAAMLFLGVMNPITNGPFAALVQSRVEPGMQGRVMSLAHSASTAMMPLSLMIAGPLADTFGVRVWYVVGGVLTVALGLVALAMPVIMNVEQNGAHATRIAPVSAPAASPPGGE